MGSKPACIVICILCQMLSSGRCQYGYKRTCIKQGKEGFLGEHQQRCEMRMRTLLKSNFGSSIRWVIEEYSDFEQEDKELSLKHLYQTKSKALLYLQCQCLERNRFLRAMCRMFGSEVMLNIQNESVAEEEILRPIMGC